jgi:hypothetical protein
MVKQGDIDVAQGITSKFDRIAESLFAKALPWGVTNEQSCVLPVLPFPTLADSRIAQHTTGLSHSLSLRPNFQKPCTNP